MSQTNTARARKLELVESVFGIHAAGRLMVEIMPSWIQDMGLLLESIEPTRPAGAPPDWQPGAVIRLPRSEAVCRGNATICGPALMALADTAMVLACSAAWNGYRPMRAIDQTMHFLRSPTYDVIADARVIRVGEDTSFGRVNIFSAADNRPVGMVSTAYALA